MKPSEAKKSIIRQEARARKYGKYLKAKILQSVLILIDLAESTDN